MDYKKRYKGLVLFLLIFFTLMIGGAFLPGISEDSSMRLTTNICTIGMAALSFLVYKTEAVYWYNGISFEAAQKAGSQRRKIYAWRHLKLFGGFALIFLPLSLLFHFLRLAPAVDTAIGMAGLILSALYSIRIKL